MQNVKCKSDSDDNMTGLVSQAGQLYKKRPVNSRKEGVIFCFLRPDKGLSKTIRLNI
jgi:hypothetical protein